MADTFAEQLAVEEVGPGQYRSMAVPAKMGNSSPIAYGGCVLSIAARAAHATVPATHAIYSMVGHFLGPTSITERILCVVHTTRNTKSFATRRVEVKQAQPDGKMRTCLELLVDFQAVEPAVLKYSVSPSHLYARPDLQPTVAASADTLVENGGVGRADADAVLTMFSLAEKYFECRACMEGVSAQNLLGLAKTQTTTQDALPMTAKTSAEWYQARQPFTSAGERVAAAAFLMDGGLSFVPLTHNHMWFDDVAACSSLDFALRFLHPELDLSNWHLRERQTVAGDFGRTYSESRLFTEGGTLVATMTQQSIMRQKPTAKPNARI